MFLAFTRRARPLTAFPLSSASHAWIGLGLGLGLNLTSRFAFHFRSRRSHHALAPDQDWPRVV